MGRKFSKLEISGTVNVHSNGQHMKANWFCVNCHCISSHSHTHYPKCDNHECYSIPATGEVPKKNASKRKWDIFKRQFVYAKPIGWWNYSEFSWWSKNKSKRMDYE